MPELPEVETVRRHLECSVGSRLLNIDIGRADILRREEFAPREIIGAQLTAISRRGKFLIFHFGNGLYLIMHMGMSGRIYLLGEDEEATGAHIHLVLHLDNNTRIIYQDPRRFGGAWLVRDVETFFAHMGLEPLGKEFTSASLAQMVAGRKVAIKTLLLNQSLICGLGNIYADEALFRAGIRPDRPAGSLGAKEIDHLWHAIREVLRHSLEHRGTTFRDFRDGHNQAGEFQNQLQVYGKAEEPCPGCGKPIRRVRIGGRSSHFCEHCQK